MVCYREATDRHSACVCVAFRWVGGWGVFVMVKGRVGETYQWTDRRTNRRTERVSHIG